MANVVLNLPLQRSGPRSEFHELWLKVTDGQVWCIPKEDRKKKTLHQFRNALSNWARHRGFQVHTVVDGTNLYVQALVQKLQKEGV